MTGVEKARRLFQKVGLTFPKIPHELAAQLKERGEWVFSTRKIDMSPYNLQHYVHQADQVHVEDYAILSHSGHGVNSYALQYYVVYGALRMFLHLGWGGVYMDDKATAINIRDCFSLADEIIREVQNAGKLKVGDRLTIVVSDFYGSYWSTPRKILQDEVVGRKAPAAVLAEVLYWLRSPQ